MLEFILTLMFLPFIIMALVMASPFIFILGMLMIIVMTALWVGQMVALVFAILFTIGTIAKYTNKEASS